MRRPESIDEQVVDERPFGRRQAGVLNLADLQLRRIVRGDVLDRLERALAGNLDLAHVRDVEQSGRGANRHVLGGDAGVLHRHVPAAKRDHASAESNM